MVSGPSSVVFTAKDQVAHGVRAGACGSGALKRVRIPQAHVHCRDALPSHPLGYAGFPRSGL